MYNIYIYIYLAEREADARLRTIRAVFFARSDVYRPIPLYGAPKCRRAAPYSSTRMPQWPRVPRGEGGRCGRRLQHYGFIRVSLWPAAPAHPAGPTGSTRAELALYSVPRAPCAPRPMWAFPKEWPYRLRGPSETRKIPVRASFGYPRTPRDGCGTGGTQRRPCLGCLLQRERPWRGVFRPTRAFRILVAVVAPLFRGGSKEVVLGTRAKGGKAVLLLCETKAANP